METNNMRPDTPQPQFYQQSNAAPNQPPYYYQQPAPQAYAPYKRKKDLFAIEKRDILFAVCAFALSLFGVIAGVWGKFNAGFTFAAVLTVLVFSVYLKKGSVMPGVLPWICGLETLLLSGVFLVTDESRIRFFALLLLPCLGAVWFAGLAGQRIPTGDLGIVSHIFTVIFSGVEATPKSMRSVFSADDQRLKPLGKIVLGLLCALPILLAVVPLLMSSDIAFSNLLEKLFAETGVHLLQIAISLALTPFLLGLAFSLRKNMQKPEKTASANGMDTTILAVALGVLSLCYLIYLFSQLAYFFSGFMGILPEGYGFSHAEYARRGFFELCAIAGINLTVLFAVLLLCKRINDKPPVILRFFACFIGCFDLILIVTAISKLALYIRTYGMTVMRIGTSAFAVFMAVIFMLLMLRYFIPKIRVLCFALPLAAAVILTLGLGNVNAFVANYNYDLYLKNEKAEIDVAYFGELGAAGAPYLVRLSEAKNEQIRRQANHGIYVMIQNEYDLDYQFNNSNEDNKEPTGYYSVNGKIYRGLSMFNLSRSRMYAVLDAFLQSHPDFLIKQEKQEEAYWNDYFLTDD